MAKYLVRSWNEQYVIVADSIDDAVSKTLATYSEAETAEVVIRDGSADVFFDGTLEAYIDLVA